MRSPTRLLSTVVSVVLALGLLPAAVAFTASPSPSLAPSTPPSASSGPIRLSPVEDPSFGLSALVPSDWTNQGHGLYTRASSANDPSDPTLLALQSAPMSPDALWPTLQQQLGLAAAPIPLGT